MKYEHGWMIKTLNTMMKKKLTLFKFSISKHMAISKYYTKHGFEMLYYVLKSNTIYALKNYQFEMLYI